MANFIDNLRNWLSAAAGVVNSVPGSLATAIEIATLDAGKIVTAGPVGSLADASAYNCPIATDLTPSDTAGLFVLKPPTSAKHVILYPFINHASAVDNATWTFRYWLIEMGYFGKADGAGLPPMVLRGNYRGEFACTASSKVLAATDPVQLKLGGQTSHCDIITPALDGEAIGVPVVTGGATANNARHGVVSDIEGGHAILVMGKSTSSGSKGGLEVRYI